MSCMGFIRVCSLGSGVYGGGERGSGLCRGNEVWCSGFWIEDFGSGFRV
jgi:hypothetical protein